MRTVPSRELRYVPGHMWLARTDNAASREMLNDAFHALQSDIRERLKIAAGAYSGDASRYWLETARQKATSARLLIKSFGRRVAGQARKHPRIVGRRK